MNDSALTAERQQPPTQTPSERPLPTDAAGQRKAHWAIARGPPESSVSSLIRRICFLFTVATEADLKISVEFI